MAFQEGSVNIMPIHCYAEMVYYSLLYYIHPKLLCLVYAVANRYKDTLFGLGIAWSPFG